MYVCMNSACDSFDGGYLELARVGSEEGLEGHGLEVIVLLCRCACMYVTYVCMHCMNECKYYECIDIEMFGSRELKSCVFYKDEQFQYILAIKMDVCKYVWLNHVR